GWRTLPDVGSVRLCRRCENGAPSTRTQGPPSGSEAWLQLSCTLPLAPATRQKASVLSVDSQARNEAAFERCALAASVWQMASPAARPLRPWLWMTLQPPRLPVPDAEVTNIWCTA